MGTLVQIYPGNYSPSQSIAFHSKKNTKVLVFDLDETLGCFSDLITLWYVIALKKNQQNFNKLLDLYPEFLRYGILTILEYLYHKKCIGQCYKLYLYTNNRFSPEIPRYIAKYFDYKLGIHTDMENIMKTHLFDQIIVAFKVGDRIIDSSRKTNNKTYGEFIRCTLLPKKTEICFIDDLYHSKMNHGKIYYIQPAGYFHNLSKEQIINRACAFMPDIYKRDYLDFLFYSHKCNNINTETHVIIAKKMMFHIKEFFYLTSNQTHTRKNRNKGNRNTRRK